MRCVNKLFHLSLSITSAANSSITFSLWSSASSPFLKMFTTTRVLRGLSPLIHTLPFIPTVISNFKTDPNASTTPTLACSKYKFIGFETCTTIPSLNSPKNASPLLQDFLWNGEMQLSSGWRWGESRATLAYTAAPTLISGLLRLVAPSN